MTKTHLHRVALVTPVFNDWESLSVLIRNIEQLYHREAVEFSIVIVDDGSIDAAEELNIPLGQHSCIRRLDIVRLAMNLGHQRAIATGLCVVAKRNDADSVIVMDSDGEDRPDDIATLLVAAEGRPDYIIMAHRAKRSEPFLFRMGYRAYKLLFRILTGKSISFGNFSLIPLNIVRRLVHMPDLWNNLAAAIIRSRIPFVIAPTERGQRYFGRSQMNFINLIVHGLSAMSIYSDVIFVRILLAAAAVTIASLSAIAIVTGIRLATDLAIPGWATTVVGDLLIVLLQTVVLVIVTALMVLSSRSSPPVVPIRDHVAFLLDGAEAPDSFHQMLDVSHHDV
jgi:polyisoprenyl-phosphate glycosyltransferase